MSRQPLSFSVTLLFNLSIWILFEGTNHCVLNGTRYSLLEHIPDIIYYST